MITTKFDFERWPPQTKIRLVVDNVKHGIIIEDYLTDEEVFDVIKLIKNSGYDDWVVKELEAFHILKADEWRKVVYGTSND